MKILAVDTSTISCSVGIIDSGQLLAEETRTDRQTHSKQLMKLIDTVVNTSGIRVNEIDGLAIVTGPGTFTGLRIGIGTIKGLALALAKPVVGISSLAALANQAEAPPYLICPLLDARRNEVYSALYKFEGGTCVSIAQARVSTPDQVLKQIKESCIFIGNGAALYRKMIEENLADTAYFSADGNIIRAATVASLALKEFNGNNITGLNALSPYYIRKSDAEINLQKRNVCLTTNEASAI